MGHHLKLALRSINHGRMDREAREDYDAMRARLLTRPEWALVSKGSIVPTQNLSDGTALTPRGTEDSVDMRLVLVSHDYFAALGIDAVAGRTYRPEFVGDEFEFPSAETPHTYASLIINEAGGSTRRPGPSGSGQRRARPGAG